MTAEETGARVQRALDRLTDDTAREAGEELVRALLALHGDGLDRLVRALPQGALGRALDDPAVAGLLTLHDLHPEPVGTRIGRALDATGAGRVERTGFDPATGTLTLRREGRGCGARPEDVENALACHAPEVTAVVWEREESERPLLQIGSRPPA
ncbi:thioredoxin, partial [Streptomyces clavuligerus]